MKKPYTFILVIAAIVFTTAVICKAQSGTIGLKASTKPIIIDGSSADWGDSLSYYDKDAKIHYAISNDQSNLYLIVKTRDIVQENEIMTSGLTFSIDPKGRKKRTFSTSFPYPANTNPGTAIKFGESTELKAVRASFNNLKKINVSGFKGIKEDDLAPENSYGIKAVIGYEADGNLVYEEVIPLVLFNAGELSKNEWSFNIKLNSLAGITLLGKPGEQLVRKEVSVGYTTQIVGRTSGSSNTSFGGPAPGSSNRNAPSQSLNSFPTNNSVKDIDAIEFWGKFTLAQ